MPNSPSRWYASTVNGPLSRDDAMGTISAPRKGRVNLDVAADPNTLTRRNLAPIFGPRSVSIGSRALGGSSTDDDGWGQWSNSVSGGYRAPRTAHPSAVVPARRPYARLCPGPPPRPGSVRPAAGGAAEPGAPGHDPPAAAAVGAHGRAGAGAPVGEWLCAEPAG